MNSTVFVVFFLAVFGVVLGFPAVDDLKHDGLYIPVKEESENSPVLTDEVENSGEEIGVRFRRVTCDLLSISVPFGSLNHSACAAHCLAMGRGYRGGRCRDGVCHCRR